MKHFSIWSDITGGSYDWWMQSAAYGLGWVTHSEYKQIWRMNGSDSRGFVWMKDTSPRMSISNGGHLRVHGAIGSDTNYIFTWGSFMGADGYTYRSEGSYHGNGSRNGNCSGVFEHSVKVDDILFESDQRIKTNIVDVPDHKALEMVRHIPCRYYNYKNYWLKGKDKVIGFIAQEVQEIFPMAVQTLVENTIPNICHLVRPDEIERGEEMCEIECECDPDC